MKDLKARGIQILVGEIIVTFIAIVVMLAFLESSGTEILRNIVVVDVLFLIIYLIWIKLFGNYAKMYKFGLKEE